MLIERCVCGGTGPWRHEIRNRLTIEECACGVQHLRSVLTPEEYAAQYSSGEYHRAQDRHPGCVPYVDRYGHDFEIARIRWRRYCSLAKQAPRTRTALDVGAAAGAFVNFLRTRGIKSYGLDPDPAMHGDWIDRDLRFEWPGSFDLVTYHDVLEHVIDPVAELRRARKIVTDDEPGRGLVVVDVPDVSVPEGEHHYKAEHPWYFTQGALCAMLAEAMLAVTAVDYPVGGKMVAYAVPA